MSLNIASAQATLRGFTQKFDSAVRAAQPFYPTLCHQVDSQGSDEKYGWLGGMPGVREWIGERKWNDLRAADYTLVNRHWEDSLLVRKTDIKDDRIGLYGPMFENLGAEASYHPDELFFTALINGASTACFDTQYFFDTDHSWGDSGTQSNSLTYAAATGTTPTTDEFKGAFNQARTAMMKFKNDMGKFLNRPTMGKLSNLVMLVPPDLEYTAKAALTASFNAAGASNVVLDAPMIIGSPHITDAATFYLFNMASPFKPFVFQAREPLTRGMKGLDDIETKYVKFMTEARYNVGYLFWFTGILTTFT